MGKTWFKKFSGEGRKGGTLHGQKATFLTGHNPSSQKGRKTKIEASMRSVMPELGMGVKKGPPPCVGFSWGRSKTPSGLYERRGRTTISRSPSSKKIKKRYIGWRGGAKT